MFWAGRAAVTRSAPRARSLNSRLLNFQLSTFALFSSSSLALSLSSGHPGRSGRAKSGQSIRRLRAKGRACCATCAPVVVITRSLGAVVIVVLGARARQLSLARSSRFAAASWPRVGVSGRAHRADGRLGVAELRRRHLLGRGKQLCGRPAARSLRWAHTEGKGGGGGGDIAPARAQAIIGRTLT